MHLPMAQLGVGQAACGGCLGVASVSTPNAARFSIPHLSPLSAPPSWTCRLGHICACAAKQSTLTKWLEDIYDSLDYEAILFDDIVSEEARDDPLDHSAERFIYGESDLSFFENILQSALQLSDGDALDSFCDLGGGKGQLALAAARLEPARLSGTCVSLELIPELHSIASAAVHHAATQDEAMSRVSAVRGDVYDTGVLAAASIRRAACVYCYASKVSSGRA